MVKFMSFRFCQNKNKSYIRDYIILGTRKPLIDFSSCFLFVCFVLLLVLNKLTSKLGALGSASQEFEKGASA